MELALSRKREPAGRGFGQALSPSGRAPEGGRCLLAWLLSQLSTFRQSSPAAEKLLEGAPREPLGLVPRARSCSALQAQPRRSLTVQVRDPGAGGVGFAPCLVSRVSVWRAVCCIRASGWVPRLAVEMLRCCMVSGGRGAVVKGRPPALASGPYPHSMWALLSQA